MSDEKKLRYRIAVRAESNHFIEAHTPEEALQFWQKEMEITHLPCRIVEKTWIPGGFKLTVELQTHLTQTERNTLSESISIDNVSKKGETIR